MEIQYLNNLKDNPVIYEDRIEGISEEQIITYEQNLRVTFPLAYREFLFLAGKYHGELTLLEGTSSIEKLVNSDFQKYFKKEYIDLFNVNIKRPHWIFSTGSQAFYFFYLDESIEDPKVYLVQLEGKGEHEIIPSVDTFSEFINGVVDYSIQYYKESYG